MMTNRRSFIQSALSALAVLSAPALSFATRAKDAAFSHEEVDHARYVADLLAFLARYDYGMFASADMPYSLLNICHDCLWKVHIFHSIDVTTPFWHIACDRKYHFFEKARNGESFSCSSTVKLEKRSGKSGVYVGNADAFLRAVMDKQISATYPHWSRVRPEIATLRIDSDCLFAPQFYRLNIGENKL